MRTSSITRIFWAVIAVMIVSGCTSLQPVDTTWNRAAEGSRNAESTASSTEKTSGTSEEGTEVTGWNSADVTWRPANASTTTSADVTSTETSTTVPAQTATTTVDANNMYATPPNAEPGQCFARAPVAARFETRQERVLKRPEREVSVTQAAEFEWVEERVLVREASYRIEEIPAEYETVTDSVIVEPARKEWKPSTGPIYGLVNGEQNTRVDPQTGGVMCLVEIPAVYKPVKRRILKREAVSRRVEIPAEYSTVRVQKMVQQPQQQTLVIPAEYVLVERDVEVAPSSFEWKPVLCEANFTPTVVTSLQQALRNVGYYQGAIDGQYGPQTEQAVIAFKQSRGLTGIGVTYETLEALNVELDGSFAESEAYLGAATSF